MRRFWAGAWLLVGVVACVGDPIASDGGTPQAGTRGGPCLPMMQCVSGLTCLDGTCVQLPDSGTQADGSLGDAGGDGMLMQPCNLPHPPIGMACTGTDLPCVTGGQLGCSTTIATCNGGSGKAFQCRSGGMCPNQACCLESMVKPMGTSTCPTAFNYAAVAMVIAQCGSAGCPGQICASDGDCNNNSMNPHCRAAVLDGTQIQFGVCAP